MPSPSIKARLGALERRTEQRRSKAPVYGSPEYWEAEALDWYGRPPPSPEQQASALAAATAYAAMIESFRAGIDPENREYFEGQVAAAEPYVQSHQAGIDLGRQRLIARGQWPY